MNIIQRESIENKIVSRRKFLQYLLAGGILVAGGGIWRAIDQGVFSTGSGAAYEPWENWKSEKNDGKLPLSLVRASILAANAHNTQPWLFRVSMEKIDLYANLSRNIGTIDPFLREMHISLGCALENLLVAAKASGYLVKETLIPVSFDENHVATIGLSKGSLDSLDLFQAIPNRHTNRGAYDLGRQVPKETLQMIKSLAKEENDVDVIWFDDDEKRKKMGDLIIRATYEIINDSKQARDSYKWYRQNWGELQSRKDGITLDASGNSSFTRALGKLIPVSEKTSHEYWYDITKSVQVPSASAFGSIVVKNETDRKQWLETGKLWQRLHLWATLKGLAVQPLNQPNERMDLERYLGLEPRFGNELREMIGTNKWHSVFTFRIGYPTGEALKSPRRSVEDVLMT